MDWVSLIAVILSRPACKDTRKPDKGPVAPVLWTFAGVVALHAAWDASYGLAILVARGLVGDGWHAEWPNTEDWIGSPTGSDLLVFNVSYDVLIALNALIGTLWIVLAWRRYGRAEPAAA